MPREGKPAHHHEENSATLNIELEIFSYWPGLFSTYVATRALLEVRQSERFKLPVGVEHLSSLERWITG